MGVDPESLEDKIASECLPASFASLRPHAARGALVVVSAPLRLVEAAVAVARNRTAVVALWIEQGLLRHPTAAELEAWEASADDVEFRAVIVQPFVLCAVPGN